MLIIMPTTLLTNWQREIARFAPMLTTAIYHGGKRALSDEMPDILLTTYGVVRSDAATLKKQHWRLVAADEAQNLKIRPRHRRRLQNQFLPMRLLL